MSLDLTKPVQTRDGNRVEIYATYPTFKEIHGVVFVTGYGREYPFSMVWNFEGECHADVSGHTLVNVTVKRTVTVWFNIYDEDKTNGRWYRTKDDAKKVQLDNCIACVEREITFEEGEGL